MKKKINTSGQVLSIFADSKRFLRELQDNNQEAMVFYEKTVAKYPVLQNQIQKAIASQFYSLGEFKTDLISLTKIKGEQGFGLKIRPGKTRVVVPFKERGQAEYGAVSLYSLSRDTNYNELSLEAMVPIYNNENFLIKDKELARETVRNLINFIYDAEIEKDSGVWAMFYELSIRYEKLNDSARILFANIMSFALEEDMREEINFSESNYSCFQQQIFELSMATREVFEKLDLKNILSSEKECIKKLDVMSRGMSTGWMGSSYSFGLKYENSNREFATSKELLSYVRENLKNESAKVWIFENQLIREVDHIRIDSAKNILWDTASGKIYNIKENIKLLENENAAEYVKNFSTKKKEENLNLLSKI